MSPLIRHVPAWLALAAVVWIPAPAAAATRHVTFTGTPVLSLGVLSCPSTPDVAYLTLTTGATVKFTNRTGKAAVLHAGEQALSVADGGTVPVTFHAAGDVSVTMLPDCTLDAGTHKAMAVHVCPLATTPTMAPQSTPRPTAATVAGPLPTAGKMTTQPSPTSHHTTAAARSATPSPSTGTATIAAPVLPTKPDSGDVERWLVLIATVGLVLVSVGWARAAATRGILRT